MPVLGDSRHGGGRHRHAARAGLSTTRGDPAARQPAGHKLPVSVLVLIHTPALEVLLLERAGHPGYWQSVTGSQEADEAAAGRPGLHRTACREVAEETGIQIAELAPGALRDWHLANRFAIFPEWRHRYGPGVTHNTEHVFSLVLPTPRAIRLAPDEHLSYRWLPWQAAAEQVFSWTNRDAILMLPLGAPPRPAPG